MALHDNDFIRGEVPLTKSEVRAVTLSKLQLSNTDHLLDIGAGTGGISIEAAHQYPQLRVTAIDNNPDAINLIHKNAQKHQTPNVEIHHGKAPQDLPLLTTINKVFIGGSKGNLPEIFDWITQNCPPNTIVVANAITLETLEALRHNINSRAYTDPEIIQLSVNKIDKRGKSSLIIAQNPIFILNTQTTN